MNAHFLTALLTPDIGLVFWTAVSFIIFFLLLKKYAWKPLLNGIAKREEMIEKSLSDAKEVERQLRESQDLYESKLGTAEKERKVILAEARTLRSRILQETKMEAKKLAEAMKKDAIYEARMEREKALRAMKKEIVELVIKTSETIVANELKDKKKESGYITKQLADMVRERP